MIELFLATALLFSSPDGYKYPPECLRDLNMDTAYVMVMKLSSEQLEDINERYKIKPGSILWGATITIEDGKHIILINRHLGDDMYQRIMHHERCHVVAGDWHK